MPVSIIQGDITRLAVDAIVNAANSSLLGGGGVDGAIHRAAGPELLAECRTLGGCPTGEARITKGYDLPAKYVIHTVGPVWQGGKRGEPELLASCYRTSLALAAEKGCKTVAFPLISAGVYSYPKAQALKIALDTIVRYIDADMTVYMVIFNNDRTLLDHALYNDISRRLQSEEQDLLTSVSRPPMSCFCVAPKEAPVAVPATPDLPTDFGMAKEVCEESVCSAPEFCEEIYSDSCGEALPSALPFAADDLDHRLGQLDESFSQMLLRLIDSSGMTDAQCYKRANIDRKLFSKIRGDVDYRPSKPTALSFAIALELDLEQTRELLMKAGFALSRSSRFDVIVEYFIERGIYNIMDINAALFAFDQPLLAG